MVGFFVIVLAFGIFIGSIAGSASVDPDATVTRYCFWTLLIAAVYVWVMMDQSINVGMAMNHGVRITNPNQAPILWNAVSNMAVAAGLPMPQVFIIMDPSPNAFSIGTNPHNSAIGATSGLLKMMDRYEIEGVIGHEMSHIRDHDTQTETVGVALTALFAFIGGLLWRICLTASWFNGFGDYDYYGDDDDDDDDNSGAILIVIGLLIAAVAWLCSGLSYLTQMALSRNREYLADAGSVDLTRNPRELIRAFKTLEDRPSMRAANPASSCLYIVNPQRSKHHWSIANLFDTHPPLDQRIHRLEMM